MHANKKIVCRCNKPGKFFSVINGYRMCAEHFEYGGILPPANEAAQMGPCDKPIYESDIADQVAA